MKKIVALLNILLLTLTASGALADSKISQLPSGGLVNPLDVFPDYDPTEAGQNFGVTFGSAAAVSIGTSGATIGLLNTANTYSALQSFSSGDLTAADPVFTGGSITLPAGTTGARPGSPTNGMIRYNTSLTALEAYVGGAWGPVSSGGGTPGGSAYQVQAANSSATGFQGLNDFFPVDGYGAVCDGAIFYEGVRTTSGSPNITIPATSADLYPGYAFTTADVGKTITVSNPAQENSPSPPTTTITTTISSISGSGVGNTAVLATNMTFTSSSYQYASARMYKTDNRTAIQAAYNAAGSAGTGANNKGGWVIWPPGVCAFSGPITFYGGTRTTGQDNGSSVAMLTVGSNSDMFIGNGFSSLTGTNSYGGVRQWSFENIMLDGNKMVNTGSGTGTASGHGDGIRVYGFEFTTNNLLINYFASDGWYSEWTTGAGSPSEASNGMEANPHDIKFNGNAGYGMVWNGPHDSRAFNIYAMNNGAAGLLDGPAGNGSPLTVDSFHGYQNGTYDIVIDEPYFTCKSCYAEGGILQASFSGQFIDSQIGNSGATGLVFNCGSGGSYYNVFQNTAVGNITNTGSCNTGSDYWYGGGYSGTNSGYTTTPSASVGTSAGFTYGLTLQNSGGIYLSTSSSWPIIMNTTSSSNFTMTNGGHPFLYATSSDTVSMGPSAAAPQAGAGLDLSAFGGSNDLALLLPVGTTAQRPSSPTAGEIRYNSSIPGVEAYYSSAWNTLGPGGGGGSPGGSNGQFQYNSSSSFAGTGGTANTLMGYITASTPAALAVPSCSGAASALIWTTGTGFGCNTISGSGGVNLGTSASATNPQRTSEAGTGFYSVSSGEVDIASGGSQVGLFNTTGLTIGTSSPDSNVTITAHAGANTTGLEVDSSANNGATIQLNSTASNGANWSIFSGTGAANTPKSICFNDSFSSVACFINAGGTVPGLIGLSKYVYGWSAQNSFVNVTYQTMISQPSAGVISFDTSTPGNAAAVVDAGGVNIGTTTAATGMKLTVAGAVARTGDITNGTKFTTSGCSISATTGAATAGTFTLGANSCTAIVTMNGATGLTSPGHWNCPAWDQTAPAVLIGGNSSSTAATASFTIPAGAGATDVIAFGPCVGTP